ncbi:MAG: cupredoxin domain-containing protein [Acidobacteria bacterium]|nr:cupredoxin domain-containing protein [Acidobacteriota bacterium]
MKPYRRITIAVLVAMALTVVARKAQLAPGPPQSRNNVLAQATPSQSAQPQRARISASQMPPGSSGPATELLKMMGVDRPDFGIRVAQSFDSSGKPAYETKGGDLLFFTNASVSYNSTADKPMIVIINVRARKIIAVSEIDMPSTPHGISLSPDAKYIYLPSGPSVTGGKSRAEGYFGGVSPSPTAVVDAKTLKVAALINTGGSTHHTHVFVDKYIYFDSFRGPVPIFLLDPATNKVVRAIPAGDFNGRPYIGFPSPDGKFIYVTVRPGISRDSSGREIDGWVSKINAETMQEIATFPVGPGPVWTAITQDGKTGYVTIAPMNRLVKLDLDTGKILGVAPTGRGPYGIRLSPDEKIAYVANKGEGGNGQKGATFSAIDTTTMTIIREQLSCPDGLCQADHILLSPDGKELWISNNMGSITIFDRETLKMIADIQMPKLGDAHGGTFVQVAPDNRSAKVVADIGGHHGGANPYAAFAKPSAPTDRSSNALVVVAKAVRFAPATLEVTAGQKITFEFQNKDEVDHNVVSNEAALPEVVLGGGQTKTVEWTAPSKPGAYKFVCTYHRGMDMTVNVK